MEITEVVFESQKYDLFALIHQLQEAGFVVALAGFGTNAEGIQLLSSAEFDVLKLNKAMIIDILQNLVIITSIVETCHEKGKCGVGLLQGFLFSKPISMEEYEEKYLTK